MRLINERCFKRLFVTKLYTTCGYKELKVAGKIIEVNGLTQSLESIDQDLKQCIELLETVVPGDMFEVSTTLVAIKSLLSGVNANVDASIRITKDSFIQNQ